MHCCGQDLRGLRNLVAAPAMSKLNYPSYCKKYLNVEEQGSKVQIYAYIVHYVTTFLVECVFVHLNK